MGRANRRRTGTSIKTLTDAEAIALRLLVEETAENARQVSIQPVESLHVWIEKEAIWYAARDAAASAIRAGDRPEPAAREAVRDLLSRQAMDILDGLRPLPSSQVIGSETAGGQVPRRNTRGDHWALRVLEGLGRGTVWLARIASAVLLLVAWRFVLEAGYVADEVIDAFRRWNRPASPETVALTVGVLSVPVALAACWLVGLWRIRDWWKRRRRNQSADGV